MADTRRLALKPLSSGTDNPHEHVLLEGVDGGLSLRPIAHAQLASTLGIPKPYYDRMLWRNPTCSATTSTAGWRSSRPRSCSVLWTTKSGPSSPIPTDPWTTSTWPRRFCPSCRLQATVLSSEVTENRFYLKAVTERIQGR